MKYTVFGGFVIISELGYWPHRGSKMSYQFGSDLQLLQSCGSLKCEGLKSGGKQNTHKTLFPLLHKSLQYYSVLINVQSCSHHPVWPISKLNLEEHKILGLFMRLVACSKAPVVRPSCLFWPCTCFPCVSISENTYEWDQVTLQANSAHIHDCDRSVCLHTVAHLAYREVLLQRAVTGYAVYCKSGNTWIFGRKNVTMYFQRGEK
jgi:hypothetical protein